LISPMIFLTIGLKVVSRYDFPISRAKDAIKVVAVEFALNNVAESAMHY
jgi:hypothetical protein